MTLPLSDAFPSTALPASGRCYEVDPTHGVLAYPIADPDFPGAGPDGVILYARMWGDRMGTYDLARDWPSLLEIMEAWRAALPKAPGEEPSPLREGVAGRDISAVHRSRIREAIEAARPSNVQPTTRAIPGTPLTLVLPPGSSLS